MKILVFSDSHSYRTELKHAIKKHKKAEVIVFCGDGHKDIAEMKQLFLCVRGNCDWYCDDALLQTIHLCGKKILITHGHMQFVKEGLSHLTALGHKEKADIVLFGHTHHQLTTADGKMLIMNPGSVGYHQEYGLIEIDEATGKITATEYPNNQFGSVVIT